jgi:hypothetical protein
MREDRYQSAAEFQEALLRVRQLFAESPSLGESGDTEPLIIHRREAVIPSESTQSEDTPIYSRERSASDDSDVTVVDPPRFPDEATDPETIVSPTVTRRPGTQGREG